MTSRSSGCLAPTTLRWLALHVFRLAVEVRLALLDEGAHGFLEVRTLHRLVELDHLPLHDRGGVAGAEVRPRLALDRGERFSGVEGDLGSRLNGGVEEVVRGQHLVHEADTARFRGVDDAPGEHQFHRLSEPDDMHEQPGAGEFRQHTDADEPHPKARPLGGITDVAGQRDCEAGANGDAVDRSDYRLRALDERDPVLPPVCYTHTVAGLFGALDALVPALDIRAGAEALAGTAEDNR